MGKNKNTGKKLKSSPGQIANLIPFNKMDPEQHKALSSKGGRAAQLSYKRRRNFKEAAEWLLSLPAFETNNDIVETLRKKYPDLDNGEAMAAAVIKAVMDGGDPRGFATIRDTTGEVPVSPLKMDSAEPMSISIKVIDEE